MNRKRAKVICAACGETKSLRARGLCLRCYEAKHPARLVACAQCGAMMQARGRKLCQPCHLARPRREIKRTVAVDLATESGRHRRPPQQPTNADAGSEEKIQVLMARYAAGEQLYHPQDSRTPIAPGEMGMRERREEGRIYTVALDEE